MLLEPKLGKDLAASYRWSESNFAVEEIVMHAGPTGFQWTIRTGTRSLLQLFAAPSRKGRSVRPEQMDLRQLALRRDRASALSVSAYRWSHGGNGQAAAHGDTVTVKQVGESFGPSQRFTMDWGNIDGSTENISLGESGNPYSPYYRDQWDDYYNGRTFALPFTPGRSPRTRGTHSACCHEKEGWRIRDQGSEPTDKGRVPGPRL